jgi:hypothetical protein
VWVGCQKTRRERRKKKYLNAEENEKFVERQFMVKIFLILKILRNEEFYRVKQIFGDA